MSEENKKKHYLIYQTTNLVNNKIYIGKHITENIEDQYFGSGKYLQNAIKKYGLENFKFKILIDLNNEEEMNLLEKCVVTQEFCDREDTYNINVGGDGGWSYVNNKSDFQINSTKRKIMFNVKGGKACQEKYKEHYGSFTKYCLGKMSLEKREKIHEFRSQQAKINFKIDKSFLGKHHSEETKQKMSEKMKGKIPINKGKITVIDINTGKKCFVDSLENLPSHLCLRSEYKKMKGIFTNSELKKIQCKQQKIEKHQAWLKETQAMANYFSKYGYKATCEKFNVSMSQESMVMRFIRARKIYGIIFKSQPGKRRKFITYSEF